MCGESLFFDLIGMNCGLIIGATKLWYVLISFWKFLVLNNLFYIKKLTILEHVRV